MLQIYIAGPMFSEAEIYYNEKIAQILEYDKYKVFLPQRSGYRMIELLETMSPYEAQNLIFTKDFNAVKESDIILIILDGRVQDEGACIELGMAYTLGKRCYGIKTDPRSMMNGNINPMITGCLQNVFSSIEDFVGFLKEDGQNE